MVGQCKFTIFLLSIVLSIMTFAAHSETFEIRNTLTGGDCTAPNFPGRWDHANKTCKLTGNVRGHIRIMNDGITVDGSQHKLQPGQGDDIGVTIKNISRGTVTNLIVDGFKYGIEVSKGLDVKIVKNTVINTVAANNSCGICFIETVNSEISKNTIIDNKHYGIRLFKSLNNNITSNKIEKSSSINIFLDDTSSFNRISKNQILGDGTRPSYGVTINSGMRNSIYSNGFKNVRDYHIDIIDSDSNSIFFNVMKDSTEGVHVRGSRDNKILCNDIASSVSVVLHRNTNNSFVFWNNFLDGNNARDRNPPRANNRFNLPSPVGGNYWSRNDPNCVDLQPQDGFCDVPYQFLRNQDDLPHVHPIPWKFNSLLCLINSAQPPLEEPPRGGVRLPNQGKIKP